MPRQRGRRVRARRPRRLEEHLAGIVSAPPLPGDAPLAEGTHQGRIVALSAVTITVDVIEILYGQQAVDAAREDGAVPPDQDDLPNDVCVRDLDARTDAVAAGDSTAVRIYDCSTGCELRDTTIAALLAGTAVPVGGVQAP